MTRRLDDSFDEFVDASSRPLFRLAHRLTGDWHASEDLVQTTLRRVARNWGSAQEQPFAYARRTLVNRQPHEVWVAVDLAGTSPGTGPLEEANPVLPGAIASAALAGSPSAYPDEALRPYLWLTVRGGQQAAVDLAQSTEARGWRRTTLGGYEAFTALGDPGVLPDGRPYAFGKVVVDLGDGRELEASWGELDDAEVLATVERALTR